MTLLYHFEHYDYYCVHQSVHFQRNKTYIPSHEIPDSSIKMFERSPLEADTTRSLIQQLPRESERNSILIMDFRRMVYSPTHSISQLGTVLDSLYKGILFVVDNEQVYELIKCAAKEWNASNTKLDILETEGSLFCGMHEVSKLVEDNFLKCDAGVLVNGEINRYIFGRIRNEESGETIRLESSNVYSNRYFDVKRTLADGQLFSLIIYRLALVLINLQQTDFNAFICASLTGSAIASGLAALFRKPMIFMKNIGPSMSASDERILHRIRKDQKYVFIYDFMCLGTEYERLRMICNIRKARIVYSVGISHFRMPNFAEAVENETGMFEQSKELNIASLFNVNRFDPEYYRCFVEAKEGIRV